MQCFLNLTAKIIIINGKVNLKGYVKVKGVGANSPSPNL
jgi:hypothetical protein